MKKDTAIPVWYSLFNKLTGIKEYDDFNSEFSKLLSLSKKENVDEQFNDLLKRYWKRVFHDIINELLSTRQKRKTKGQQLKKEEIKLMKLLSHSEKDLELEEYENLYTKLVEIKEVINEKIEIEKFEKKRFYKGLIIGFLLGILASIVGSIIFSFLKCGGVGHSSAYFVNLATSWATNSKYAVLHCNQRLLHPNSAKPNFAYLPR